MANPIHITALNGNNSAQTITRRGGERYAASDPIASLSYIPYIPDMSTPILTRTFKSGNSVAVRLPKGLAIAADVDVMLEQRGNEIVLRPVKDPAAEKQKLLAMLAALKAIGPVDEIETRGPFEFPDRPGL